MPCGGSIPYCFPVTDCVKCKMSANVKIKLNNSYHVGQNFGANSFGRFGNVRSNAKVLSESTFFY